MCKKLFFIILISLHFVGLAQESQNDMRSLTGLGTISVTIGGNFVVTGSFPALMTERVDQFVTRIHTEARQNAIRNLTDPVLLEQIMAELNNYTLRGITLKRASGEEFQIDLLKFRRTGDFGHNPYLKNDDVLIFPPADIQTNFFSISGAVNKPGKYHFMEGDDLPTALQLAQGLNPAYENTDTTVINRLSYSGEQLEEIKVLTNEKIALQRGDRIIVGTAQTHRREFSVIVAGEVKNPGEIPVTRNGMNLKQVIEKAGGLTGYASLKNARVYTGNTVSVLLEKLYGIKLKEAPELLLDDEISTRLVELENQMMYRMSNVLVEDTAYFFLENNLRVLTEGSAVDFERIFSEGEESSYKVRDGDVIVIPPRPHTVYVYGQVPNPGHIEYSEGKNYKYYLDLAGGMGDYAGDEEEIMVIKADSRNWISPIEHNVTIEPGDYIWVPKEPVRSFDYYVYRFGNYVNILGGVATIILLIIQLGK